MNRLALALGLPLFLNLSTKAQDNKTSNDDTSAVRATVTNYIEGYFTGDAERMEQTLHPHYLKQVIHAAIRVREMTGPEMLGNLRSEGAPNLPAASKTEQVSVLDVAGDIASTKLITPGWTDYVTLSKANGEWTILSVVQRID
jgi:hypothetical protein